MSSAQLPASAPTGYEQERLNCTLSAWTGTPGNCQWCDQPLADARRRSWCSNRCARAWEREHVWRHARAAAKRRAKYHCEREACLAERLDCEVNHLTPRDGAGYGPGCHHHQRPDDSGTGGLEVLCRRHHAEVTAAQATTRAARRKLSASLSSPACPI